MIDKMIDSISLSATGPIADCLVMSALGAEAGITGPLIF